MFAWALRTGRAASVPACPSAWRPPGPNPSYRDLLSQLHYSLLSELCALPEFITFEAARQKHDSRNTYLCAQTFSRRMNGERDGWASAPNVPQTGVDGAVKKSRTTPAWVAPWSTDDKKMMSCAYPKDTQKFAYLIGFLSRSCVRISMLVQQDVCAFERAGCFAVAFPFIHNCLFSPLSETRNLPRRHTLHSVQKFVLKWPQLSSQDLQLRNFSLHVCWIRSSSPVPEAGCTVT